MLGSALAVAAVSCELWLRRQSRCPEPETAPLPPRPLNSPQRRTAASSHLLEPCAHQKRLSICINHFVCCHDNLLWQKPFRPERVYLIPILKPSSIMVEKSQRRELEATCHFASIVNNQTETDACPYLMLFLLYSPVCQLREWYHPQWAGLPTSINLIKIIPL